MFIERIYNLTLNRLFKQFPALLITGPRQVGKTSLLRHLFPDATYVTLDLPAAAHQAEENPADFLSGLNEPVILDEVQYAPRLFRHLKLVIDAKREPGRFLLTGSQTFALMEGVSESLAGRTAILEMRSLSFAEIRAAKLPVPEAEYVVRGGYPALYDGSVTTPSDWYAAYLANYLERDVRNMKNVGSLRDFERFLRAAAVRCGQMLSLSDLARDVGVAPNTAKAWLSVLEASGQIFLLEPYHVSLGKRLVKSPKLYFHDAGLACFLLGIETWKDVLASPLGGAIWETHVVGQWARHFLAQGKRPPLWYWRTQHDEVDLLVEKGGRFTAVECKLTAEPDASALKGLKALERFYGKKVLIKGYVACRTERRYRIPNSRFEALPGGVIPE